MTYLKPYKANPDAVPDLQNTVYFNSLTLKDDGDIRITCTQSFQVLQVGSAHHLNFQRHDGRLLDTKNRERERHKY